MTQNLKKLVQELNKKIEKQAQIIAEQARKIEYLLEENQLLRNEISRFKKQKKRPRIPPSSLERPKRKKSFLKQFKNKFFKKLSIKKKKKVIIIEPENIPKGSRFKGYREFTIQEIKIEALDKDKVKPNVKTKYSQK